MKKWDHEENWKNLDNFGSFLKWEGNDLEIFQGQKYALLYRACGAQPFGDNEWCGRERRTKYRKNRKSRRRKSKYFLLMLGCILLDNSTLTWRFYICIYLQIKILIECCHAEQHGFKVKKSSGFFQVFFIF